MCEPIHYRSLPPQALHFGDFLTRMGIVPLSEGLHLPIQQQKQQRDNRTYSPEKDRPCPVIPSRSSQNRLPRKGL